MKTLHYPTYASYRETAEGESLAQLGETLQFYRERLAQSAGEQIKQCYRDALRAYEDELLCRDYDRQFETSDDPFFETDVAEYQPGDMIDFGC